jgi:hypothetical protein
VLRRVRVEVRAADDGERAEERGDSDILVANGEKSYENVRNGETP